jgi:hypothetical protein
MTLNHNYECSNEAVTGIAGNKGIEVSTQIIPERLYIKAKAKLERAGYTVKKL